MALLIEWPSRIDKGIINDIISFKDRIEFDLRDLISETIMAYNSLTISLREPHCHKTNIFEKFQSLYKSSFSQEKRSVKLWHLPVCYDESFGLDLVEISKDKNIDIQTLIKLHTSPIYDIFFIGFLPGFLYLGGLSELLFMPRKSVPRKKIIKGAVAIGGQQTGIYPAESPGGWNIIGNCPVPLFDIKNDPPCFASPGDSIKFHSISLSKYDEADQLIQKNKYVLEPELIHE